MDSLELTVTLSPREPWTEILIYQLSEIGFDSFVETEQGVQAYIESDRYNESVVLAETILSGQEDELSIHFETKLIPYQNWNAAWEADFHPVFVEEYATILAPFHNKAEGHGLIVEIQPQMSFGTGHHQTTWLMTKALFELPEIAPEVLDMGTGTGVLAIIAEKLGAKSILAIDIEYWSAENAKENADRNQCVTIETKCGDIDLIKEHRFGLILANINKNVLKSHMESYATTLEKDGVLLLSGFFETDVEELIQYASQFDLVKEMVYSKETWACIKLLKK